MTRLESKSRRFVAVANVFINLGQLQFGSAGIGVQIKLP